MFDYPFVSSWALDNSSKPIDLDFFTKLSFIRSLRYLNLEETIYFSLLDLNLHNGTITPQSMVDINTQLMASSFSYNYSTDNVQLKTFSEQLAQNIKSKGDLFRYENVIDQESRQRDEEQLLDKYMQTLFTETE